MLIGLYKKFYPNEIELIHVKKEIYEYFFDDNGLIEFVISLPKYQNLVEVAFLAKDHTINKSDLIKEIHQIVTPWDLIINQNENLILSDYCKKNLDKPYILFLLLSEYYKDKNKWDSPLGILDALRNYIIENLNENLKFTNLKIVDTCLAKNCKKLGLKGIFVVDVFCSDCLKKNGKAS